MPIVYFEDKSMYDAAWDIAETNRLVHLYDAVYIALSEGIEFWTADERLVNSLSQTKAILRQLGK